LLTVLCRDFPVGRRANAEARSLCGDVEIMKKFPPLVQRLRKKRTKLKKEERQRTGLKRRGRCKEAGWLRKRKNPRRCPKRRNRTKPDNPKKLPRGRQGKSEGARLWKKRAVPLIVRTTIWKRGGNVASLVRYIGEPRESANRSMLLIGYQGE